MNPRPLWLIGDFGSAELAAALEDARLPATSRSFASVAAALELAGDRSAVGFSPPAVVVIAQSRPGEIAAEEVEQLHSAFPLARLVLLLGAWCEGEMRTGVPIAGVTRIFWHAFAERMRRLLAELESGQGAPWAFPRIAGEQQRLLQEIPAGREALQHMPGTALLIRAVDLTTFETLADGLRSTAAHCIWLDPRQWARFPSGSAIVWDAPQLDAPEWQLLAECRAAMPDAPIVLLTGFPRQEDAGACKSLGIGGLIAKPYLVADLAAAVKRAIGRGMQAAAARQIAG